MYLLTIECYDAETVVALIQGTLQSSECNVLSILNGDRPLSDDETAEDISVLMDQRQASDDKLRQLEAYVTDALSDHPSPDQMRGMIADIKGVQATVTHSNDQMRALDHLITMLSGEISRLETDSDPTPPYGIRRPMNRPKGSGARIPGLEDLVPCSGCGAEIGQSCMSGTGLAYASGYGHAPRLHAAKAVLG